MFNHKTRIAMVAGIAAIALLAGLCEGQAFAQCCGSSPVVTTYARPYSAGRVSWTSAYGVSSACNPWVPGSCGYSVYRPVTTTAFMPVTQTAFMPVATTACSPCASGANCVTTLQTRQVPGQPIRNLFRILLPPYRPVPVTTCYTPTTACYPSSCTSCYSGSCAPTSCSSCYTPSCSSCSRCTSCGSSCSSCSSGACDSGNATPSYYNSPTPSSSTGTPSTYKESSQSNTELRLMPTPDANTAPATFSTPKEADPDTRTAMQPIRQAVLYRPVSLNVSPAAAPATIDVGGWHASSD